MVSIWTAESAGRFMARNFSSISIFFSCGKSCGSRPACVRRGGMDGVSVGYVSHIAPLR